MLGFALAAGSAVAAATSPPEPLVAYRVVGDGIP